MKKESIKRNFKMVVLIVEWSWIRGGLNAGFYSTLFVLIDFEKVPTVHVNIEADVKNGIIVHGNKRNGRCCKYVYRYNTLE